jgi:hypothetical protein
MDKKLARCILRFSKIINVNLMKHKLILNSNVYRYKTHKLATNTKLAAQCAGHPASLPL